jgi:hypothetical protein
MKCEDGRLTPEQEEMIPLLESMGHKVEVCYTAEAAIKAIERYCR